MNHSSQLSIRLHEMGMTFEFFHLMLKEIDDQGKKLEHPSDLWFVKATLGDKVFGGEFFTGIGNRLVARGWNKERGGYYHKGLSRMVIDRDAITEGVLILPSKTLSSKSMEAEYKKIMYELGASFIHSSLLDATSSEDSFREWAINCGYSPDSIQALQTYLKCQEVRNKLIWFLGSTTMNDLARLEH